MPRYVVLETGSGLQRLLRRHLQDVEIVGVTGAEQAIAELQRSPAQALIVNDPSLVEAGPASARLAAGLPHHIPAIACWIPTEEEAAGRLGVVRYLVKPVTQAALLDAIAGLQAGLKQEIRSVLVVDDQYEAQQLFARMLAATGKGYRVLRAANGQRALELARERKPDLMLLDLVMPGMDGYQMLKEKSADPTIREIPVIVISATDPRNGALMGSRLVLMHGGGWAVQDVLSYLQLWSEAMSQGPEHGTRQLRLPQQSAQGIGDLRETQKATKPGND